MTKCKINNEEMVVKGIDEIPMFSWNTQTKEFYVLGHKFDGANSIEDFINYIHNLDRENMQLKEENMQLQEKLEKCVPASELAEGYRRKNKRIDLYKSVIDDIKDAILKFNNDSVCIKDGEEKPALTKILNFDEARELLWSLLEILDKVKESDK